MRFKALIVSLGLAIMATLGLAMTASAWVPDDGSTLGHTSTNDTDDDSFDHGTGVDGFTTSNRTWYYDHGDHLHADFNHMESNCVSPCDTIEITDVHVRVYQGKCNHNDGTAWNFPACRDSGTLGPKEFDQDFTVNWGMGGDHTSRDFDIHNRVPVGAGYAVIDYSWNCARLLTPGCGSKNHTEAENKLGY